MAGKKRGLGRGLDALLGPTPVVATVDDAAKNAGVNDVPLDQEEKVYLLSSSDTYGLFIPGFSLHEELEFINSSGLSTYETLKTTTINPARYLNTISQEGTVNIGKNANLVLLNKNPLENIKNTRTSRTDTYNN